MTQLREDVTIEKILIEFSRAKREVGPLIEPSPCVLLQGGFTCLRIHPSTSVKVCINLREMN
jgi:hypothetical protein